MQASPYLFFDGNCEEAFRFYAGLLGGKVEMIGRFRDFATLMHRPGCVWISILIRHVPGLLWEWRDLRPITSSLRPRFICATEDESRAALYPWKICC